MDAKWWQKFAWLFVAMWANIDKRTHNDLQKHTLNIIV